MSFAEIQGRLREMDAERARLLEALQSKRAEEIKVLADAYAKKVVAGGFTIKEGLDALRPYDTSGVKQGHPSSNRAAEPKAYLKGTVYKDPASEATWVGGTKGRMPPWLRAVLDGATDKAKALEGLAVKG